MKQRWKLKTLGEVCRIELGKTPHRGTAKYWDTKKRSDNIWLSIADLPLNGSLFVRNSKEHVSDVAAETMKLVPRGTPLVSFKLTLGRIAIAGRDLYTNEAIAALYINSDSQLDRNFLLYNLSFFDWHAATEGDVKVKGKTFNKAKLKEIPIPLPPLEEQKRIVAVLDEAFAGLEAARTNAEANLKNAEELFQTSLRQCLGEESFEQGWESKKLGDVARLINGRAYKKPELLSKGKYPVLRVGNFFTNQNWYYSDLELPEDKYCEYGDLLYAWSASFGPRIWLGDRSIFHYHIWKVELDTNVLDKKYLYYFFEWDKESIKVEQGAGATMIHVSMGSMNARSISLPPLDEQTRIVALLDDIKANVSKLKEEYILNAENITNLRQSVLQKAFAGELTSLQ